MNAKAAKMRRGIHILTSNSPIFRFLNLTQYIGFRLLFRKINISMSLEERKNSNNVEMIT